jgi:hypothetical protein
METFSAANFLNKKYTFINEPIHLKENDYEDALNAFVEKFSAYPNVISLYKFGSISSVGISDLDFVAVLKEEPLIQSGKDLAYHGFSQKEIYIYNHTPPMYMTEGIFRDFKMIFPLGGLQLIYGKDIEQNNTLNDDAYSMLTLIELLSKFYPKVFLESLYADNFNIRRELMLLHALTFPINLAGKFIKIDSKWLQYKSKIAGLREKWYMMGNERCSLLVSLTCEAVHVSLELIYKVSEFLQQNSLAVSSEGSNSEVVGNLQNGRVLFISNFSTKRALEIIIERYKLKSWPKRFNLVMPDMFVLPMTIYREMEGTLSCHLRKNLKITKTFQGNLAYQTEAKKRMTVLNSLINFIEKYKVYPNGVHIYYGYWPRVGLKNRILLKLANTGLL